MNSDSHSSKPKRSVGNFLRQRVNKVLRRSPSPLAPLNPSQVTDSGSRSRSPSQSLTDRPSSPSYSPQAILSLQSLTQGPAPSPSTENIPPILVVSRTSVEPSNSNDNLAELPTTISHSPRRGETGGSKVWTGLGTALRELHKTVRVLPPLQSAVGTLVSCLDVLEAAFKDRKECNELALELGILSELLAQHMNQANSTRMTQSIAHIARCIEEQARIITNKRTQVAAKRLLESTINEELRESYQRIGSLLRRLHASPARATTRYPLTIEQTDATLSVWNIVNDQAMNARLKDLEPAKLAAYDSKLSSAINRRTCTNGTRTDILSGLEAWTHDLESKCLYWMNGMAGTGKTTIACTFSEILEERNQLAASFFCTRAAPECRDATRIIPTIAYQLARYSVPFLSVLCEVLAEDPDASSKNMARQFERLLKQPLEKVREAIPNDLVVVIDALDECDDVREVELLLSLLLKSAVDIPLRFFVTSRPEPEIYSRMISRAPRSIDVLHLHDVESSLVQTDVELYFIEELEFVSPSPTQLKELVQRSGNLFIYAATLVRLLSSHRSKTDPRRQLQSLLATPAVFTRQNGQIDKLYTTILEAALNEESEFSESQDIEDIRRVMQTVVCIQEPIGVEALAIFTGLTDVARVLDALQPLRAVIHFSEKTQLVSILHVSFPDFVFDQARSKAFYCNPTEENGELSRQCFWVMKSQLRFNICHLESSFVPDSDIIDLGNRVKQNISIALSYACRYWGIHLRLASYSDSLAILLDDFLSMRLLFWMEVLNLTLEASQGASILLKAKMWLRAGIVSPDLIRLVDDARNLVTSFAAGPVSQCTPHIYISLLPFSLPSSHLYRQYQERLKGLIRMSGTATLARGAAALATWQVGSGVNSIAYSPDGNNVAFGCDDGTVRILSTHDGRLVINPIEAHTDAVFSVAYSRDGSRIVSCAGDRTIRVWSAEYGTLVAGPFKGHTDRIWSVAFSPDGERIVSGSNDKTICIWDAYTGTLLLGPFGESSSPVQSVAYSPDGSRIVSGSSDKRVQVWNAHDGTAIAPPFEAHDARVRTVSYSPDGTHIVSGSDDGTIRVWSSCDGVLLFSSPKKHKDPVLTVAYSPDGLRIASGSEKSIMQIWDAQTGDLVPRSFRGHKDSVQSMAYSPDGIHIISGSLDESIRVWSAHNNTLVSEPCEGHAGPVWSVSYSSDSTRFVSGSIDQTIRVWDAANGMPVANPIEVPTGSGWSVAFSPNDSCISSCSSDGTIRSWSALDGSSINDPSEANVGSNRSITRSPDGARIALVSKAGGIQIRDVHEGTILVNSRAGTSSISSVAYSSDGTRIVTGSFDGEIQIFNEHDLTLLLGPFHAHSDSIRSAAFSPEGIHIVSSSDDQTIQVWNARDGTHIAGPFKGHTDTILSVSYSPDGTRIVSGSYDCTIRVWGVEDQLNGIGNNRSPTGSASVALGDLSDIGAPGPVPRSVVPPGGDSGCQIELNAFLKRATIRPDGWVVGINSQRLFWVPHDFVRLLPLPPCLFVISPIGTLQFEDGRIFIGEQWARCYKDENE